jgi:MFS family permease
LTPEDGSDSDFDPLGQDYTSIELQHRHPEKRSPAEHLDVDEEDEDEGDDDNDDDDDEKDERPVLARRGSASTTYSFQLYTPDEERAVVRKFDRRLVLFVALLYMLSFLDRSSMCFPLPCDLYYSDSYEDIGNARIAGMDVDLDLHSNQYEWVLTSFYITYILFEWMSLLWKIIPAHIYMSIIVLSWGITSSLQALSTSFVSLIILRILLGIGEAGFTGIPYFLSFFYKKEELALRTGLFISAAPLATSFASSLAWAILKFGENGPIAPWRLLFLLEGFPSVFIAVLAWHIVPDGPAKAKYLSKRERKVARLRLRRRQGEPASRGNGLKWKEVLQTVLDPKAYLTAFMLLLTNMAFASMPAFLPTIIRSMGHSSVTSQALSAPPYLLSWVIVILTAYLSDRLRSRSTFIVFHALLSASGYLVLALAGPFGLGLWWRYAAIYPAAIGFFSVITIIITWAINNQESESKQGAGFAMLQLIGQCGPLIGTRLYPDKDAPYYTPGMASCAAAMVGVAILAVILRVYLSMKNRRPEIAKEAEYTEVRNEEDGRTVGKRRGKGSQGFIYML